MGGPDDRFGVASVTRKTALACLERVCALGGIHRKNEPLQLQEYSREELLPIEQLMTFAHENGLRVLPIRFDWFRLLATLSNRPVLLVLKNANVITAEKLSTSNEIIVFDPLAPADESFLVARAELEPVWDGNALMVEPELANGERHRTRVIALAAACAQTPTPSRARARGLSEGFLVTRVTWRRRVLRSVMRLRVDQEGFLELRVGCSRHSARGSGLIVAPGPQAGINSSGVTVSVGAPL
jgi:hypothetical protein